MKKLFTSIIILVFVFTMAFSVYAAEITLKSVDTILSEIRQEQGVKTTDKINPDKVSQAKLEELGDSFMEAMIGNTEVHEKMDIQHGGDGSASLTAFHIRLGYNYLVGYPNGMMALMSSGMMGPNRVGNDSYGWGGMMGNNNYYGYNGMMGYFGWGGIIIGIIVSGLFIIILFFIVKAFIRKPLGPSLDAPLDILRKRYANGELKQEEYERMADHLRK